MTRFAVIIESPIDGHVEVIHTSTSAEALRVRDGALGKATVLDVHRPPQYSSEIVLGRWDNTA